MTACAVVKFEGGLFTTVIGILRDMVELDPEPYIRVGDYDIRICYHCAETEGDPHAHDCVWKRASDIVKVIDKK